MIQKGTDTFLHGGYGKFDLMAAAVLRRKKERYPHIQSLLVLAYPNQRRECIPCDEAVYPSLEHIPKRYAIIRRNQWMVDQADIVIAFIDHDWGGAAQTLTYAQRKKKEIIRYE